MTGSVESNVGTEGQSSATLVAGALDLASLRSYLRQLRPDAVHGELSAELLAGGHSNLTFLLRDDDTTWVLRRPPLGHVDTNTHDMFREYRVMRALWDSPIPVPEMLHHCGDPAVIGAPFFLSAFVAGTVY